MSVFVDKFLFKHMDRNLFIVNFNGNLKNQLKSIFSFNFKARDLKFSGYVPYMI